ncbi:NAD(P)-dependent oxidoreductase [Pedobacter polaris]|uniref:NAD(P)-dependent oxidoreductase n=1 Tax=Pedobacter polaris TaxID=2571273 RepID=A0A4U1CW22_9SPHI|nr:NAD(P)-dependent oxidoreductase [Pedobacter polaris]TKC13073.1 NAD(P)-dependent oxidoreductase [Pedobacter polaris]
MKLLITGGSGFIGTNLLELLLVNNVDNFINVDKQKPLDDAHSKFWVDCNILDKKKLLEVFTAFEPTHVVHLAAKTDTASDKLEDYNENTDGTANLIEAIEKTHTVVHVVITSTQYVYKSKENPLPRSDKDYIPHTTYGISKKITEELTHNSKMKAAWTVIRPTNVWGPWNMRYPNELLKIVDKGWYFHPGKTNPVKSYAYVKNVVHQIFQILQSDISDVNHQTYYVGDEPMKSLQWINSFSRELTGKTVKSFPIFILHSVSFVGDILRKIKIPFPLHSERFNNMLDNYETPMKKTIDAFGLSNPNLDENVKETIDWLKNKGKPNFEYWKNKY